MTISMLPMNYWDDWSAQMGFSIQKRYRCIAHVDIREYTGELPLIVLPILKEHISIKNGTGLEVSHDEGDTLIDSDGSLRCDRCGKKLAAELKGEIRIVCPKCKTYNTFKTAHTASFASHLTKQNSYGNISFNK